uniref:Thyroglobulin type-1 domain-containing protein n=1 Tax=Panagrellus redivivus TaxID=6233 RepID=A0A7E4ZY21_PANRE
MRPKSIALDYYRGIGGSRHTYGRELHSLIERNGKKKLHLYKLDFLGKPIMKTVLVLLSLAVCVGAYAHRKRDASVLLKADLFKDECIPRGVGKGCECTVYKIDGTEDKTNYENDSDCKKAQETITAELKASVLDEFKNKYANLREGCFPRPKAGCRCAEKDAEGNEVTKLYNSTSECSDVDAATVENARKVKEELLQKYANLRDNCFPRPKSGCRCNEKDSEGNEIVARYDTNAECQVQPAATRVKRGQVISSSQSDRPSQNVRDPVREKAQANYAAVVNELKQKFAGLREGCYPRPKGCLCVTGKDQDGRELTQRYMKDSDCKCQAGSPGCPAAGA